MVKNSIELPADAPSQLLLLVRAGCAPRRSIQHLIVDTDLPDKEGGLTRGKIVFYKCAHNS